MKNVIYITEYLNAKNIKKTTDKSVRVGDFSCCRCNNCNNMNSMIMKSVILDLVQAYDKAIKRLLLTEIHP